MFTNVDRTRSTLLKREENCAKQLRKIRSMKEDLIMILTSARAESAD
jgi:hypothetical protein